MRVMKIGLLLGLIFTVGGGCAIPSAPPTASIQESDPKPAMEIRYDVSLHPDELSTEEKSQIIERTAQRGQQAVWFVYVRYNRGGILTAYVYFTPDVAGQRIRRGFCA